ncbi:solute carrier family 22 member 6-A-like [Rhincodon typus]|uniref:solute carrier family 22 member 6-A-like n=1 Tax=Rhincodon typus TaxID=259920 RepID=UPI002030686D|nr:solute carrier family 22 member 6-A-like [Rhincodon typus]
MGFGDILEDVGSMGKFQVIHILLLVLPSFLAPSHNLLQNFLAAVPDHHCRIRLETVNDSRYVNVMDRARTEDLLRVFIPLDQNQRLEKCLMYSSPQWHLLDLNETHGSTTEYNTQKCTDGWTYDDSKFKATIVTEWDLVCNWKSLKRITQSIYMAGLLVGAIVLGRLSDKFGRRSLLLWSHFQLAVSGMCGAFSSSYSLFCFWRFLCGLALSGIILNAFSLKVEWIPTRFRTPVSMLSGFLYTFGQLHLAGLAYGIQDWRWLQFTVSLPYFVFFLYSWFSTSFAYYGLAIDLQGFGVNIYLIQIIFGAVDIPAKVIAFLFMSLIGRRFTQGTSLILAGSFNLANIFVPKESQALRTSFAAIGKGCLSAAFSCCYLFTGELYPTVVRQTGMGLVSTMARVGAMIAPIVRMSGDYVSFLPMTIYGGMAIIAGFAAFLLPETRNTPLPETIEETENRTDKCAEKDKDANGTGVPLQETYLSLMKQTV